MELIRSTVQQLHRSSSGAVAPLCGSACPLYDVIQRLPAVAAEATATDVRGTSPTFAFVALRRRIHAFGDVIDTGWPLNVTSSLLSGEGVSEKSFTSRSMMSLSRQSLALILTTHGDVIVTGRSLSVTSLLLSVTSSIPCRRPCMGSTSGNSVVAPCQAVKPSWSSILQTRSLDESLSLSSTKTPTATSTSSSSLGRRLRINVCGISQYHIQWWRHQCVWSTLRDVRLAAWSSSVDVARGPSAAAAFLRRFTRRAVPGSTSANLRGRLCLPSDQKKTGSKFTIFVKKKRQDQPSRPSLFAFSPGAIVPTVKPEVHLRRPTFEAVLFAFSLEAFVPTVKAEDYHLCQEPSSIEAIFVCLQSRENRK